MRYIRTKDGIYDKEKCCIEGQIVKFSNEWFSILEQADAIEELCDERVLTHYFEGTNYTHCKVLSEELWKVMGASVAARLADDAFMDDEFNFYGAIWVIDSDGVPTLKPVAKMTKKGELELL